MKKLVALLIAGAFIVGCSSDKPQTNDNLVVVKHNSQCWYKDQNGNMTKVACKRKHYAASAAALGS